ncbi:hypothetical protein E2P84_20440 [Burkholderia cepacia]|uniref:DUF551 domain-containing protein n=1 Tax=Burkholderia cepacia TaxID=292 RepID=A0AAX2RJA6_BURCE|nr:hypothetical protein [Burkholderia cepacia]TES73976.1 hypothetical protein E2P84_20440 [Burkholderia cepacia]TET05350.1 hypothetical protein E3D36_00115 [Burkholderia cepacia]TEU40323.1 hypothetical protein E3D37_28895 [Burkholderia cepacia]TEU42416.1 hypothetical protein E3D39_15775 [Burkholderia cepacia]TEU57459.1 hypothetical protein E3D38_03260 [Burkholderia cepacia]
MKITDDMLTEWRKQFEAEFPMPPDCIWTGNGYSPTRYDAWRAQEYAHMWNGFVAGRRTTPDREAWQPIGTAPKFGDPIDIWGRYGRTPNCVWGKPTYVGGVRWVHEAGYDSNGPVFEIVVDPTHWMPLPTAPTSDKGGAR